MTFATLFLGLVVGTQPVEIVVTDPRIAAVELTLDGGLVGRVEGPPWVVECPFGDPLAPHELRATGLDAEGAVVASITQRVNVPRTSADVAVALERDDHGRVIGATFRIESVEADPVAEVTVRIDGRELTVRDVSQVRFPPLDPDFPHVLEAELVFRSGTRRRVDATFGGRFGEEIDTRIAALPLILEDRDLPSGLQEMAGWLAVDGTPATITGVEEPPGDVVFVREPGARTALYLLEQRHLQATRPRGNRVAGFERAAPRAPDLDLRHELALPSDVRIRVLGTLGESRTGSRYGYDLFRPSPELSSEDGGILWILSRLEEESPVWTERHPGAAVATAGLIAARENRRRAVVLVRDGARPSGSDPFSPEQVRCFLADLRVPLFVWNVGGANGGPGSWGESVRIDNLADLRRAVTELSKTLERQRIVWVAGDHLPSALDLSAAAEGVRLPGPSCPLPTG